MTIQVPYLEIVTGRIYNGEVVLFVTYCMIHLHIFHVIMSSFTYPQ